MRGSVRHAAGWLAAIVLAGAAAGCSRERPSGRPGELRCAAYSITPDSIDMHTGVTLHADGDTAIRIMVEGNTLRRVTADPSGAASRGSFGFTSAFPVFDALLRIEQGMPKADVCTWLTPYELFLNPFVGAEGERLLHSRLRNGYIVPAATRRYDWPVINDNHPWLLAAAELYNITANRASLARLGDVAQKVTELEEQVTVNPVTGLTGGVTRYMVAPDDIFPQWFTPGELTECTTFAVNAMRWGVMSSLRAIDASMAMRNERSHLPELAADPDSLRRRIFRHFWNPAEGNFHAMLYGHPVWQLPLSASDNIAQSVAILTGLPLPDMTALIAASVPAPPTGVEPFTPVPGAPSSSPSESQALVRTLWSAAMARSGNDEAYNAAVGALIYASGSALLSGSDAAQPVRAPLSALVLRGFCGITTAFDGLHFSPSVPSGMPGEMTVSALRYRRCQLTVTITGTGNNVTSFTIDGKETPQHFFPASSEGEHHIRIVLDGTVANPSARATLTAPSALPPPPSVVWATPRLATVSPSAVAVESDPGDGRLVSGGTGENFLWLDGVITESVPSGRYALAQTGQTTMVQFCNVAENRYISFSSAPHLVVPASSMIELRLASVAKGGTRIIEDKRLRADFVESNRYKNRRIRLPLHVQRTGRYAVEVHYVNGLGIVNPRRRTALRSLSVDGHRAGVLVFTQLSPMAWDSAPEHHWQTLTAFTAPLIVELTEGKHTLEMAFYQPSPVYIDPENNIVLADEVRLYLMPD